MIYLDNAATSYPKPKQVARAMKWALDQCGNPGRGGHDLSLRAGRAVLECRQALSDLFHVADPFRIVFCYNCTDALNLALNGMIRHGGHVVTTVWEHNSVLRPLYAWVRRGIITWKVLRPDSGYLITAEAVRRAIEQPNTCLVAVNHVSNVTGVIQPIREIAQVCRDARVPLLVDGAQAAGHIPVDLSAISPDLYAFAGHKGLLGPQGTGGLYIGPSAWPEPLRRGGTGSATRQLMQPDDMPDRYESGTLSTPGISGLWAGVEFLLRYGELAHERSDRALQMLTEGLRGIPGVTVYAPPGTPRVGVVAFNVDEIESVAVAGALAERYGIACRPGFHCAPLAHEFLGTGIIGAVRMSPGPYTTEREIEKTIRAVARIAAEGA